MSRGPGKWQKAILAQLVKSERILPGEFLRFTPGWKQLDQKGRVSRRVAFHHAAKRLAQHDPPQCRVVLERHEDRRGRRQDHVVIRRPGSAPAANIDAAFVIEGSAAKPEKFREEYVEQWVVESYIAAGAAAAALGDDALDDYWDWLHPAPDDDFDEVDNPEQIFDCCEGVDYDRAADRIAEYESDFGPWRPNYVAEQAAWKLAHGPFEPDPTLVDHDLTPERLTALTAEVLERRSRRDRL